MEVEAIARRLLVTTPGPWAWDGGEGENLGGWRGQDDQLLLCWFGNVEQYYPTAGNEPNAADRTFIAHAWADIKALLVENHQLRETVRALEDALRRERVRRT